ncbi:hypothetical protein [Colwellia sp. E2M01]|uniref:hypothetical protein n=1 Tax=Colwellia sp. E2M01 TaxID=2841561 RepID=UPI001C09B940|nr:hypothetical protein [Colwellia sp. E2M01]MBU2871531.1 hypothetical protein [Colwellia sp. E2M01]
MLKFLLLTLLLLPFFSYSSDVKTYTQLKPLGSKPAFAPYPFHVDTTSKFGGAVTNNGRFAIATFKTYSPATLAKQLLRKNPWAVLGLTALAFFQDEDEVFYKPASIDGSIPDDLQENQQLTNVYQCHGVNNSETVATSIGLCASWAAKEWEKTQPSEYIRNVSSAVKNDTTLVANHDWCTNYAAHSGTCVVWSNDRQTNTGSASPLPPVYSCPPDSSPSHAVPYQGNCVQQEVFDTYHPSKATLPEMATALSDSMTSDPYADWDWKPFMERENDEFISSDSVDSVNEPLVSDQFNEYLKSVASGNYQTTNPDLPNYVPSEFVKPTQAAIKATEEGQPLVDPTTDDIVNPDITNTTPVTPDTTPSNITINFPEDDTISQTEYEQSVNKFFDDFGSAAESTQANTDSMLETARGDDSDFIDSLEGDITNADFPELPFIKDLWPNVNTGQCIPFTLNVSLRGQPKNIVFDKHCPPYNTYVNPMLTYFLYIITALYTLHLAGRTFTRTVS